MVCKCDGTRDMSLIMDIIHVDRYLHYKNINVYRLCLHKLCKYLVIWLFDTLL